jgi:hypothetical protein
MISGCELPFCSKTNGIATDNVDRAVRTRYRPVVSTVAPRGHAGPVDDDVFSVYSGSARRMVCGAQVDNPAAEVFYLLVGEVRGPLNGAWDVSGSQVSSRLDAHEAEVPRIL